MRSKKKVSLLLVVAAAVACAAPVGEPQGQPAAAQRDTAREVVEAHRSLVRAWEQGDAEAFLALVEPSAELLIFHPRLESRFDGLDEIREGLTRMFARTAGSSWYDVHPMVRVRGDVAWYTGHVLIESPGVEVPFIGRGTEIWVCDGDVWRLAHAHWSDHPAID